jgi:sec-independent protein translocase protein TatA
MQADSKPEEAGPAKPIASERVDTAPPAPAPEQSSDKHPA